MPLRGFPLGGSSLQSKVMRGSRTTFRHFSQQAALYSTRVPGFPVGEAVGFCRLKRSLHAFPLPEKKFGAFIFFGKNVKPCLVPRLPLASSCLRTIRQKLSALFQGFPSGGGSLQSKVVRGCSIFQRSCSIFHRLLAFPFVNPCRIAVRQSRQAEWRTIASRERSKSAYTVRSLLRVAVQ